VYLSPKKLVLRSTISLVNINQLQLQRFSRLRIAFYKMFYDFLDYNIFFHFIEQSSAPESLLILKI